jgi:SAM-dependent methyltransferase
MSPFSHLTDEDFAELRGVIERHGTDLECFRYRDTIHEYRFKPEELDLLVRMDLARLDAPPLYTSSYRIVRDKVGNILTTDFPDVPENRVFPWTDEAETVVDYIEREHGHRRPRTVLDMCCGDGAIALALARLWPEARIVGADINDLAIRRAEFNRRLNHIANVRFVVSDLFQAIDQEFDLIVGDPPFALQPPNWREHRHSAGDYYGDSVIQRLFRQVAELEYLRRRRTRFVCLVYSLGDGNHATRLEDLISREFMAGASIPSGLIHPLPDARLWRFGEEKCIPRNPMPVQYMIIRCGDPTYQIEAQVRTLDDIAQYFHWLESDLIDRGYTHLHYCITDVDFGLFAAPGEE